VFVGSRHDEYVQRMSGASYEAIARNGGGIAGTVAETRAATADALHFIARRLATAFPERRPSGTAFLL